MVILQTYHIDGFLDSKTVYKTVHLLRLRDIKTHMAEINNYSDFLAPNFHCTSVSNPVFTERKHCKAERKQNRPQSSGKWTIKFTF